VKSPGIPERSSSSTKSNRSRAPFWLRWFGWLLVPLALTACGGAPGAFRTTIAATAEAVKAADAQVAPVYGREADRCRVASASWAEFDDCLETQSALKRALESAVDSLRTAEAVLDSWDDSAEEGADWYAFVPCLSRALSHLSAAFASAGFELPDLIRQGLSFAAAFGGQCRGDQ
jgi:hypothetical protein